MYDIRKQTLRRGRAMEDVVDREIFTRFKQNSTYLLSYSQLRQMPSLSRLQTATG